MGNLSLSFLSQIHCVWGGKIYSSHHTPVMGGGHRPKGLMCPGRGHACFSGRRPNGQWPNHQRALRIKQRSQRPSLKKPCPFLKSLSAILALLISICGPRKRHPVRCSGVGSTGKKTTPPSQQPGTWGQGLKQEPCRRGGPAG